MPKLETRNSKLVGAALIGSAPVRDFTDLVVWRLARDLRVRGYGILRSFPREEQYALANQLRRALISVTANIAEGFGRYSFQENIQFCRQSRGSAYEVRDHLIAALDAGYVSPEDHAIADALAQRVIQTLNGYIRATLERQKANKISKRPVETRA